MKLTEGFELLATAPDGVARLRELILSLAVRGKLVPQDPKDEPASELLRKIRAEKDRLIKEGNIKRDKPLEDIAEDEAPYAIPQSWAWVRFGELGTIGSSSRVHQRDWTTSGVPFYRAREIVQLSKNDFVANDLFITIELFESLSQGGLVPERDDIMITGVGTIGVPYIVKPADKFYFKDASVLIFKNRFCLDPNYLSLFLKSPDWVAMIHAESMGTTVHTLTIGRATETPIPLPSLAEQSRIVARVDELMHLVDELEARGRLEAEQHARLTAALFEALAASESAHALTENWSRVAANFDLLLDRPEVVDALEQTILQLAVRGLLVNQDPADIPASKVLEHLRGTGAFDLKVKKARASEPENGAQGELLAVPRGWESTHFGRVVESLNGYAFKSEWFTPRGVRLVRNVNISHGRIEWQQVAHVDAEKAEEFARFALEAGDIVLSLDRPIISTGLKYAEIVGSDLPCLLLQRVAKLTPRAGAVTREFLKVWMASPDFTEAIDPGRSNGVPHISTKQLEAIPFALPPVEEQGRIVVRVAELRRLCADLRARLTNRQTCQVRFAEALVAQTAAAGPDEGDLALAA